MKKLMERSFILSKILTEAYVSEEYKSKQNNKNSPSTWFTFRKNKSNEC